MRRRRENNKNDEAEEEEEGKMGIKKISGNLRNTWLLHHMTMRKGCALRKRDGSPVL